MSSKQRYCKPITAGSSKPPSVSSKIDGENYQLMANIQVICNQPDEALCRTEIMKYFTDLTTNKQLRSLLNTRFNKKFDVNQCCLFSFMRASPYVF